MKLDNFTRVLSKIKYLQPLLEGNYLILDKTQMKLFSNFHKYHDVNIISAKLGS